MWPETTFANDYSNAIIILATYGHNNALENSVKDSSLRMVFFFMCNRASGIPGENGS